MRSLLGFFVILLSIFAQAQTLELRRPLMPPQPVFSEIGVHVFNPEFRLERGSSQDLEIRTPLNVALSYVGTRGSVLVEYSKFTETSGNVTSSIDRDHQEMMAWGRYHLVQTGSVKELKVFRIHAGVGLGGYEEEVTTTLMGDSRTDKAAMKFMSGLELGADMVLYVNDRFGFSVGAEARGLFAADFNPNPTWSGVVRLGLIFPL